MDKLLSAALPDEPDPLATGSAISDTHTRGVCGTEREVRYHGPIYGNQPETLCLHCIHSGAPSHGLGTKAVAIDGSDVLHMPADFRDARHVPDDAPLTVITEITRHTPGFTARQDPTWLYHCGDSAAFLGPASHPMVAHVSISVEPNLGRRLWGHTRSWLVDEQQR